MSLFSLEWRRFTARNNLVVFLLYWGLALFFVYDGVQQYKDIQQSKENFCRCEQMKLDLYINYSQYGGVGFRILSLPSPLSVFFSNSSVYSELTANVNSADMLKIYRSLIGRSLYANRNRGYKDFSGIMLLLGTLLLLYTGNEASRKKDYLKFLSNSHCYRKEFKQIHCSRLLILNLYFLVVMLSTIPLLVLNGIFPTGPQYVFLLCFQLVTFLVVLFFYSLGAVSGLMSSRFYGFVLMAVFWFIFVLLIPSTINKLVAGKASNITEKYNFEIEKLKLVMDFERKALDEAQRYTNMNIRSNSERNLVESYWDDELQKIHNAEKKMQKEMEDNREFFHTLSSLFPSTFYLSVNNELSSCGYNNFFEFYRYVHDLKNRFARFYINKRFYSNYSGVEPFIEPGENVFVSGSSLPGSFRWGAAISLFYSLLLLSVTYVLRFKRKPESSHMKKIQVDFDKNNTYYILCKNEEYQAALFSSYEKEPGAVCIGNVGTDELNVELQPHLMVEYFCKIKNRDLNVVLENLSILGIKDIKTLDKKKFCSGDVLKMYIAILLAGEEEVIIINDFVKGKSREFEKQFSNLICHLADSGKTILYLSTEIYTLLQPFEEKIKMGNYNCIRIDFTKIVLR